MSQKSNQPHRTVKDPLQADGKKRPCGGPAVQTQRAPPDLKSLLRDAPEFRKRGHVTAEQLPQARSWLTSRGDRLQGKAGDWLVSDGKSERTVDDKIFSSTYRQRPDGQWEKHALVRARCK